MKKSSTKIIILLLLVSVNSFAQIPPFNVTVNSGGSTGYYYYCPYNLTGFPMFPAGTQNQMVLDQNGHVVYYKPVAGYFAGDFKQHKNGLMSYAGGQKFYLMDSTFTIIDSIATQNGVVFDLHDLQILPNGHYLLLGNEDLTMDLSSYHIFNHNGTPGGTSATVTAGVIQELDSAKNVVWEWHSIDHFAFDDADDFFLTDPNNVDWTHMNAVEKDSDGNIIVSSRHFAEITKINYNDSSIMWRMGGKQNQFTFLNDTIMFLAQHDCRRLPNGHLTLFDNGRGGNLIHPAIAKEYVLDEVNMTADLVWFHMEADTIFSRSQGNVQRLANGNTLISWGNLINENAVFTVVDSMNQKVFEVSFPDSQITYRTFNVDSLPWLYNRPNIICTPDSAGTFLVADSGYSSYMWSTGETTQSIQVSTNDSFFVYVPFGSGGFISSDFFVVTDSTDPCGFVSVHELEKNNIILYPNPANDKLHIRMTDYSSKGNVEIIDLAGRIVESIRIANRDDMTIDVSKLIPGIYYIRAGMAVKVFVKE